MKKPIVWIVILALIGTGAYFAWWNASYYTVVRTDVNPSPEPVDDLKLVDDLLEDKIPAFDAELIDHRDYDRWQINKSAAVIQLDCPDIRPEPESAMTRLYPSYANAIQEAKRRQLHLLPSANMLDGMAKQFDDGLYAALDLACFQGEAGFPHSAVEFAAAVFAALPPQSDARPYLGAALQLGGRQVDLGKDQRVMVDHWISQFEADISRSKPISFYTWNDDLRRVWKFFRFLQHGFEQEELGIPLDIGIAIAADVKLSEQYKQLIGFYFGLTNPPECLNLSQLTGMDSDLKKLARQYGVPRSVVSVLPPSTSRETELFNRLFAGGGASGSNLMVELVRRIRSGEMDLTPRDNSGWYDHQLHALETLVLPERGQENQKLLLTSKYKRRLIQAFEALITKRRETHARQVSIATDSAMSMPPQTIKPRLRVEPCATFYLRTARSYAFLESFLQASVGSNVLGQLHGLREEGQRELDLLSELAAIKGLFYGFHLVACEDIGMLSEITDAESVDTDAACLAANEWLSKLDSPDLEVDTRVSVPILFELRSDATRLWATIGVRLAKLDVKYARPPSMREDAESPWQVVENHRLDAANYVIAVDEYAELRLPGRQTLTRQELRDICDQHKTKTAIVESLSQ